MVPAVRADSGKVLSADVAVALGDMSTGLTLFAAPFPLAAFAGATAIIGLRTGLLPTWWNWVIWVPVMPCCSSEGWRDAGPNRPRGPSPDEGSSAG